MMRSTAEPPVQYLLHDILKIKRGTYLSNYGKVFRAFYWVYLTHVYGSILAQGRDTRDWNFFMRQALAIWVEETVMRVARVPGTAGRYCSQQNPWVLVDSGLDVDSLMRWPNGDCHVWVLGWLSFEEPYHATDLSACTFESTVP
jgi:hypothetical protein